MSSNSNAVLVPEEDIGRVKPKPGLAVQDKTHVPILILNSKIIVSNDKANKISEWIRPRIKS